MTHRAVESFLGLVIMGFERDQSKGWVLTGPMMAECCSSMEM